MSKSQLNLFPATKICRQCGLEKPKEQFTHGRKCVTCVKQYHDVWSSQNKDRLSKYYRDYFQNNSVKVRVYRRNNRYKRKYGITTDEYNRLFEKQGGVCAICGSPPERKDGRLRVDHDHKTGKVRGLLCHLCNVTLGSIKDDKNILLALLDYITKNNDL